MKTASANSKHLRIEETRVFQVYVDTAQEIWNAVMTWPNLAQNTVGRQLVSAADSVGANLVEGDGRYSDAEALHFFAIARASARETRYWVAVATDRNLFDEQTATELLLHLDEATQMLNALINYRRKTKNLGIVREGLHSFGDELTGEVAADVELRTSGRSPAPNAQRLTPNASFQGRTA